MLQEEKVIQGIPWSVLKVKKDQPDFNFKAFIDTLSKGDLDTLMDCMQQSQTMEGRVTEAVELIGMVPKIMKQGGLTKEERSRIDTIMKNFNLTKRTMEQTGTFGKVDRDRYRSMQ